MKKLITALFLSIGMLGTAQTISPAMENAVKACAGLSKAIGATSTAALKSANHTLREADIVDFADLWLVKGNDMPVDGHFIFDEEFVDSLVNNREVIKFSGRYSKKRAARATMGVNGRIKMTTRALKAGQTAVWKTVNRKNAEYAVVAEPGGLFTMTIRDEKGKVLYTETVDNKLGASVRKACLNLPDKITKLFIEIKNTGKSDSSFALLGN